MIKNSFPPSKISVTTLWLKPLSFFLLLIYLTIQCLHNIININILLLSRIFKWLNQKCMSKIVFIKINSPERFYQLWYYHVYSNLSKLTSTLAELLLFVWYSSKYLNTPFSQGTGEPFSLPCLSTTTQLQLSNNTWKWARYQLPLGPHPQSDMQGDQIAAHLFSVTCASLIVWRLWEEAFKTDPRGLNESQWHQTGK